MAKIHWSMCDKPQKSITLYVNGERKVVAEDNAKFEDILQALKNKEDPEDILAMVDKALSINKHCRGLFVVIDGMVTIDGKPVPDALSNKIISFEEQGVDVEPLVHFWRNLSKNPSFRSRQQLYRFLDANSVPIVEQGEVKKFKFHGSEREVDCSGFFVSWKSVRKDFMDHHSGTFDNSPGTVVEMDRGEVNDDPNVTCSNGLHVAAWDYARCFMSGGTYVMVYVDPADVVSVPIDYNDQKMRTCRYYVVEEIDAPESVPERESELVRHATVSDDENDDYDEDDDVDNGIYGYESDLDEEEYDDDDYDWVDDEDDEDDDDEDDDGDDYYRRY